MENSTTQELMNQLTDRLILKLNDNEIPCPTCKGLRFIYRQEGENGYIENCHNCYSGKHYVCKHCGESHKTDDCDCDGARESRYDEQEKFELERFNNAEKIGYKDYDGYFLWGDRAYDKDGFEDILYDLIYNGEELPKYMYATQKDSVSVGVDVYGEISDNCADGYEDMIDYLDVRSDKLKLAQKLIDEWVDEQGTALDIYYEDYKKVVLLDDIVEKIRKIVNQRLIDRM